MTRQSPLWQKWLKTNSAKEVNGKFSIKLKRDGTTEKGRQNIRRNDTRSS